MKGNFVNPISAACLCSFSFEDCQLTQPLGLNPFNSSMRVLQLASLVWVFRMYRAVIPVIIRSLSFVPYCKSDRAEGGCADMSGFISSKEFPCTLFLAIGEHPQLRSHLRIPAVCILYLISINHVSPYQRSPACPEKDA